MSSIHAAQESKQKKPPCSSAQTTADMRDCESSRYKRAQQELDTTYKTLMNKLDAVGKSKLQSAQTAWIDFRKTNADYLADAARGGTLAPLITVSVWADMTEARVKELQKSEKSR